MMQNQMKLTLTLVCTLTLARTTLGTGGAEDFSPPGYSKAQGALVVAREATLLDVVLSFENLAGQKIVLSGDARESLGRRRANPSQSLEVPASAAHSLLEILLAENGFALTLETDADSKWLAIYDSAAPQVENEGLLERALFIPPDDLLQLRQHPALLVRTTLQLPNVELRFLGNALQRLLTDPIQQQILPCEEDGSLQIAGPGRWAAATVASLVRLSTDWSEADATDSSSTSAAPSIRDPLWIAHDATLFDLMNEFGRLADLKFSCTDETLALLKAEAVQLSEDLSVPAQSVRRVVELMLAEREFALTDYKLEQVNLVGVASLKTSQRESVCLRAGYVPVDRLSQASLLPAQFVTTVIQLPGIDVRQLSNSLRSTLPDSNTSLILPLGRMHSILLRGFGPQVFATAELLGTLLRLESGAASEDRDGALLRTTEVAGPLRIGPDSSMLELVRQYEKISKTRFVFNAETQRLLNEQRIGLFRELTVPPPSVHRVFERLAVQHEFALTDFRIDEPHLLGISSFRTRARSRVAATATLLDGPPKELIPHSARLFTVVVSLPGVDVRQLSNSMRTMFPDANTTRLLPLGNTNSMLLTGFGSGLDVLIKTLRRVLPPPNRVSDPAGGELNFKLPQPSESLRIERDTSLLDILVEYETKAGVHFLTDARTRGLLEASRANLEPMIPITPDAAQVALEMLLACNGFSLSLHEPQAPVLVTLHSVETSTRPVLGNSVPLVPLDRLSELLEHPATIASAVVHLPGSPVRQIGNSLRAPQSHGFRGTGAIVPMGSSESMLLAGAGPWLAGMVQFLRDSAREERAEDAPSLPTFPTIDQPLKLRRGSNLLDVVHNYEQLTSQSLVMDTQTLSALEASSIDIPRDFSVPPVQAQSTFESLLLEGGFALTAHDRCSPLEWTVICLNQVGPQVLNHGAGHYVPESRLEQLRGHPGLLVHTLLELPGVDVRQLTTSPMGSKFSDLPSREMMALGTESHVVLMGPGSEVFRLADELRRAVPVSEEQ